MNTQLPMMQAGSLTVSQDTTALVRKLALDHLRLRLRPLNRALRELSQARADRTGLLHQPAEDRPSITNQHMLQLFEEIEAVTDGNPPSTTSLAPNSSERAQEAEPAAEKRHARPWMRRRLLAKNRGERLFVEHRHDDGKRLRIRPRFEKMLGYAAARFVHLVCMS